MPIKLARIGDELARDWVVCVSRVDEGGHGGRDCNRIMLSNARSFSGRMVLDKPSVNQVACRL
jgi:hypothetical protein